MNQIPPLLNNANNLNGTAMHGPNQDNRLNAAVLGPQPLLQSLNMNFMPPQMRNNENNFESFQNPEPPVQNNSQVAQNVQGGFQLPPPNFFIPDLSRPPPGFSSPALIPSTPTIPPNVVGATPGAQVLPIVEDAIEVQPPIQVVEEIKPNVPYYELPAGLMVPLIRLEDYNYRPLDPEEIRLPPPTAPSERLLQAVEAFYSLPSHDRPRDG